VFWDSEGVIHVDFIPHGVTINAQYFCDFLHIDVHQAVLGESPRKLSKKHILLQNKARPHTAN
jgi:hypothetical protein